jgi:HAD superfamily hydrolase (TIGR01450 family)
MTPGLLGTPVALREHFDVALIDLDGVAYRGPAAIPTAPPALAAAREAGMRLMYVTNNASREAITVAEHLTELGMPTSATEVLTAAQAVGVLMKQALPTGATVYVVGGAGLRVEMESAGFVLVGSAADNPDAVVQGFSPDVSWRSLAEAAYAVRAGAQFFASNLDLTIPNDRGIAPGNGSLVQAVITASGAHPVSAGKPEPEMFRLAAERAGAVNPMVIGDRLDTDLKGARAAGFPGLMVFTGVNNPMDTLLAVPAERPAFLGADLSCLAEAHPAPVHVGGWWDVRGSLARVRNGVLEVEGDDDLDSLRAACAASWSYVDAGGTLDLESIAASKVRWEHV